MTALCERKACLQTGWLRSAWRRRLLIYPLIGIVFFVSARGLYVWSMRPIPTPPTEIYRGVTYSCFEAHEPECTGLVHVIKVDLTAPGIELYLTPLDHEAVSKGYEYRLDWATNVLEREHLAVIVNAAMFASDSGILQMAGDMARGGETIVADTVVDHIDPNSYLLWFDRNLASHLEFDKPPAEAALRQARWAIGGQGVALWKGKVREAACGHETDKRTAIAIDARRRLLWLAVFQNASTAGAARVLASLGAQDGILVDGGHSSTVVLGPDSAHVKPGSKLSEARPVATFFGVRAQPIINVSEHD